MIKTTALRIWADIKKYGWAGVLLILYYVAVHVFMPVSCPLILATGFPCAGCGMTRAVTFVLTGQFSRAFFMNPLAFLFVLFALYGGFCRYVKGIPPKGFLKGFVLLFILLILFYVVRMYLYFPNRVPYVYYGNNMLSHRLPGYRELVRRIMELFNH